MYSRNITLSRVILDWQIDKLCLVLAVMFGLPFLVHFLPTPAGQAAGAVWLPIFYAPLIAVLFFRPQVAFMAAFMAPALNRLLTGLPDQTMSNMLTIELLIFVFVLEVWHQGLKDSWFMGAVAYAAAKILSVLLFRWVLGSMIFLSVVIYAYEVLLKALPGIGVLTLVNLLALRIKIKERHDQAKF